MINSNSSLMELPNDFEVLIKGLGNRIRFKIAMLLKEEGDLSLSKIVTLINRRRNVILNHIKKLELSGIVQNYLKKSTGSRDYSFYTLTKYGNKFISDLINTYNEYYERVNNINKIAFTYQKEIPEEFDSLLRALSSTLRFKLTLLFLNHLRFSFSEITKLIGINNSLMKNHLNKLELGGIIQNYFEKNDTLKDYSFYTLTDFGRAIITTLIESYNSYYSALNKSQDVKLVSVSKISPEKYFEGRRENGD